MFKQMNDIAFTVGALHMGGEWKQKEEDFQGVGHAIAIANATACRYSLVGSTTVLSRW